MEAVQGKRIIYKYRLLSEAAKTDAWMLAFVTENEKEISVDADSTQTKDGVIRTPGAPEITISSTSVMAKDDANIDKIEEAHLNNELFEIWEINLDAPATTEGKYKGTYYQGYCTDFTKTSNAEDMAELELEFGINGKGAKGDCTVTTQDLVTASYVFTDTTKTAAESSSEGQS